MAYLPKEKLLLENDIVNTNNLPTTPTRDMTVFRNQVKLLKLDVQQIVPIHGRPMAWSDFEKMFPAQPRQTAAAN